MSTRLFSFIGSTSGTWRVVQNLTIAGEPLPDVPWISVVTSADSPDANAVWTLRGITSNERYVERDEKTLLVAQQQGLGRSESTSAVMIALRKSAAWWAMTQDERRAIFEEQSHHNQIGMHYLPAIARRLHHCRDLSENEPFDFITWFEFAPEHETAFNQLLHQLRATEEWQYVEREVECRLVR